MNLFKAWWYRLLHHPEPYHPLFAEAPESCGCRNVNVIYGCMNCGRTACPEHREHPCPDPVDEVHDGYERAKYFTEEEAAADVQAVARLDDIPLPAHLASTAPRVVAGQDLTDSVLIGEIYQAFDDYRHAVDITAGAPVEPSPEVKR